jgi:hypothetical protein
MRLWRVKAMSRANPSVDLSRADREDLKDLAESDLPVSDLAKTLLEVTDE